jgi:hypothetical protein
VYDSYGTKTQRYDGKIREKSARVKWDAKSCFTDDHKVSYNCVRASFTKAPLFIASMYREIFSIESNMSSRRSRGVRLDVTKVSGDGFVTSLIQGAS